MTGVSIDRASDEGAMLLDLGLALEAHEDRPILNADAIAAAVVGPDGRIAAATPAFRDLDGAVMIDGEALRRAARLGRPVMAAAADTREAALLVYASAAAAATWRLPEPLVSALREDPRRVAVVTTLAAPAGGPLAEACRAHGLSGLQTRVVLETIRKGSVREAARALDLSYHTAREALAEALRRTQAPRLPALVHRLTSHAFGVLPRIGAEAVLTDLWGLSTRQAAIAGLVAEGLSRGEAARALSLSDAVVKKELDRVYLALGAASAADLARMLAEAQALRWLTRSPADVGFMDGGQEPLRFIARPGGGRIAISDYGPGDGRPLLVVHSSVTSRVVARGLLRALHGAGYRPIAIDRPGFGLSDPARAGQDHYALAALDAVAVLDALGLRQVDLIARGGAQFVLSFARLAAARLGRVLLVNPDPHSAPDGRRVGPFGVFKEAFRRNPTMIRAYVTLLARQYTLDRYGDVMGALMKGSPPDEAAARDPEIVRDYFRAQRMFAAGRTEGCVAEQVEFARGAPPPPLETGFLWTVLVAEHDTLHDPEHVLAYWRRVLPSARFARVAEAGRLLALSHPHLVVAALADGGA